MTFDPSRISVSDTTGIYPSITNFSSDNNTIRVATDGDPYPAKAGSPFINSGETFRQGWASTNIIRKQSYDLTFENRNGRFSSNPQDVQSAPIGIAANGVLLKSFLGENKPLPTSFQNPPENFNWNTVHFNDIFGADRAGGYPDPIGTYTYTTGLFVPNTFSREYKVYSSNDYYNSTSFGNDFMRHPDGHSKIVGYAFDGYPIYGPYGYDEPMEPLSRSVILKSSWSLRSDDYHRPDGAKYTDTFMLNGQEVNYSAGSFVEDFRYLENSGHMDQYNGRYCVTPEFPEGTYAYFVTFSDINLTKPAFPYIVGLQTKQNRSAGIGSPKKDVPLWSLKSGSNLITMIERRQTELLLPISNFVFPRVEVIAGDLPLGLRINGTKIVGTPFEVERDTVFRFVLRAYFNGDFEDRTFNIIVTGPDDPTWITDEGQLPIGTNNSLYVLDNALVDFNLQAIDSDIPAGDELDYFIADGDGNLPPGLTLDRNGNIKGIVEPLLALDRERSTGGYDTNPYDTYLADYGIKSSNGFDSFYYDSQSYGFSIETRIPKKLNRYYEFAVTVTDGDNFTRRRFKIYLVGDDFLRADNTLMQAADGVFTADNTYLRNPVWLTPSDLGFRRANNYNTLYLDVIESDTLAGIIFYELQDFNPDNTVSKLPPGMELDGRTGEIVGRIPYQPAVTQSYKFTIRATRFEGDLGTATIFATYYEDTLLGNDSFKVGKLDRSLSDGVDDLNDLIFKDVNIQGRLYKILRVDGNESDDYDVIYLDQTLAPDISLVLSKPALIGQKHIFVSRLTESEKQKYQNSNLKFGSNESYSIEGILPYLEYRAETKDGAPLYINESAIELKIGQEFVLGDWVYHSGGVYKLVATDTDELGAPTITHIVKPQTDQSGAIITDQNGDPLVLFDNAKWALQAGSTSDLSEQDNIDILTRWLQIDFPQGSNIRGTENYETNVYVKDTLQGDPTPRWSIRLPSTANSRNIPLIKKYFYSNNLKFIIIRDNEDRLILDNGREINSGLLRNLSQGQNIGVALFRGDFFSKNINVAEQDEVVDLPFTDKTFDVRIIGEIDSTIEFVTDGNLGSIPANLISTLSITATTTVPDTNLIYTVKSGKLPNGLRLNLDGDIIGKPRQYASDKGLGLTTFDNKETTFDGSAPGITSYDREYKFTVEARDRFNISAITKEFTIKVEDEDQRKYSNIVAKPMLKQYQRNYFTNFVNDSKIFTPESIYRPDDPNFGIQKDIKMLVYAGIETRRIDEFVAATAKNHKRRNFKLDTFKVAEAKQPGSTDVVYEVVYIQVQDPAQPVNGKARNKFNIKNNKPITVDSIQYETKDDATNTGTGFQELPVYGRDIVKFVIPNGDDLIIQTRDSGIVVDADNNDFEIELRDGTDISIELNITDSEPQRLRPNTNTIKVDSNAIKISNFRDQLRYLVNIDNMRDEISKVGNTDRDYLPLWMRTPQSNTFPQELDYTTAIPICYCKPGTANDILLNIKNSDFDQTQLQFDIDRYIIDQTEKNGNDQFILFANYQYNV